MLLKIVCCWKGVLYGFTGAGIEGKYLKRVTKADTTFTGKIEIKKEKCEILYENKVSLDISRI